MTKRKANPKKGGRPRIPEISRRAVLLRWDRFNEENPKLPAEVRFQRFCAVNRDWLRAAKITVGEYQVLKNVLTRARKARGSSATRRISVLLKKKAYMNEATKFALGLPSLWRPLSIPD